jgi:hypothetical protein
MRQGCDVIKLNQVHKSSVLRSPCLVLRLPHRASIDEQTLTIPCTEMVPIRRMPMTIVNHETAKTIIRIGL